MFIVSFFIISHFYNNLLLVLIILELIILNLLIFIIINFIIFNNHIEILYYLTFVVCERVINLTILILLIRNSGNDSFKLLNLII